METTFGFFDLIEAFSKPGCSVCNLLLTDVHRLLDSILYEYVTDPEIQASFRDSRGLCNEHGWQLLKLGNALGIAVLYEQALGELLKLLKSTSPGNDDQRLISLLFPQNPNTTSVKALEPTKPCLACKLQDESEARYIRVLSDHIVDEQMHSAYRDSDGLCLQHFTQLLHQTQDVERSRLLIALQTEIWTRLRGELEEFMRKSNFQYADEKMGVEGNSWQRVVARLGGEHGVFGRRRAGADR